MLEHEPEVNQTPIAQTPQQTARDTRVTAEEFSAAIDALERRKAEEASRLAGTVAIGQTLEELRVDATPEDILREVELQRARKAAETLKAKNVTDARAKIATDAVNAVKQGVQGVFGPKVGPVQVLDSNSQQIPNFRPVAKTRSEEHRHGRGWFGGTIGSIALVWFMVSLATGHMIHGVHVSLSPEKPFVATTQLSAVPPGQTAYVNTDGLHTIIASGGVVNNEAGHVGVATNEEANTWPVTLHDGKYYLSGYIPAAGMADMLSRPIDVFNDDNSGALHGHDDNGVTLPLDGAQLDSYTTHGDYSEIVIEKINVDSLTKDDD